MKSLLFSAILLATSLAAHAQSTKPVPLTGEWTKQQLTDQFWAEGACVGDVNKDGKKDILCGPYWYEAPGFTKKHEIYDASRAFDKKKDDGTTEKIPGWKGLLSGENEYSNNFVSYASDINSDGWVDYIVIGFPGKPTYWYENPQGKEGQWPQRTILDVTDNESPMFVDITGDGKPELLCMSKGFLGYAQMDAAKPGEPWKWKAVTPNSKDYQRFTHGIGCGDVNGDKRVDILEATGWWEQPEKWDGTTPWIKHEAQFGSGGAQMFAYDVNGDKKTDVICSLTAHEYGLAWFEQTSDGGVQGWNKHVIVGATPAEGETHLVWSQIHAIDLVDMNGDGLKDIITGKRFWAHGPDGDPEPNAPSVLYWLELKREGSKAGYTAHLIDDNSGVGTQVMATDVNGDHTPDVVIGNKRGCFLFLRNPRFTPPGPLTGEWTRKQLTDQFWAEGICVGDVNHDGRRDIFCGPFWYEAPEFTKRHNIYPSPQEIERRKDDGTTEKIPGFKGFLSGVNDYSTNFLSHAFDINGDGWIDYTVTGFPGEPTFWYENPQGRAGMWTQHLILQKTDNESPMLVDITGDGKPELLCMIKGFLGYAQMDTAKPGEPWAWHAISAESKLYGQFTHGLGYGDVNGDGRGDILEATGWWEHPEKWDGVTPWTKHEAHFGTGGAQMYAYDVNGDGRADLITSLTGHQFGLAWFEQTSDGGVEGWIRHVLVGATPGEGETGLVWSQMHAIDLVDMNGDGLKDIITGKRFWAHGQGYDPEPDAPAVLYWLELKRGGGKASYTAHLIDDNSGVGTQVLATDINDDGRPDVLVGNKRGCFVHFRK